MIKILIADDHLIIRQGLRLILETESDFKLVGEASDGAEAVSLCKKIKPEKAYLTHISHLLGFHDEVEKDLPDNVFLAYDNLKITI